MNQMEVREMGLAEVQKSLAMLYTDARLRERFFADPPGVGRELGLSEREAQQLARLSAWEVRQFAGSLHGKRMHEITKLLPLTYRFTKERFAQCFDEFADSYRPDGIKKHLGDALAFAAFLEKRMRERAEEPAWVFDLLRYEKARLVAADPTRRCVVCTFRHDISRLVRSVARREEVPAVHRRRCVAFWLRPRRCSTVRYSVVTLPQLFRRKGAFRI